MIDKLDCRGLDCPAPVLHVRDLLEKESPTAIAVLVDNEAAWQNVKRFLEHQHYHVSSERQGAELMVVATRRESSGVITEIPSFQAINERPIGTKKIMVLITGVNIGHGDDGLGDMLMFNFIKTLKEMGPDLWRVVFVNGGVSFTAEGSEAVPILQELEERGVQVFACGACLAYFHILDKIQVGEVTNMLDIVTGMKLADSVVTI